MLQCELVTFILASLDLFAPLFFLAHDHVLNIASPLELLNGVIYHLKHLKMYQLTVQENMDKREIQV